MISKYLYLSKPSEFESSTWFFYFLTLRIFIIMHPLLVFTSILSLSLLSFTSAYDSRNVSNNEFICGGLFMSFYNFTTKQYDSTDCGNEILYNESQIRPIFILPKPNLTDQYVIIIVDRDAPSASNPIRSPLRHFAAYNISGNQLLTPGLDSNTLISTWFNYSGPQPPAYSGCHRYYGMVYRQNPNIIPELYINFTDPTNRLNWNFVEWANNNSLEKIGVNYWTTQNMYTRNNGCYDTPSNYGYTLTISLYSIMILGIGIVLSFI